MTDREKLIELIGSTEYGNGSLIGKNFQKGFIEKIADHLIANGVSLETKHATSDKTSDKNKRFETDTNVGSKWMPASEPPEDWKGEGGYLTNYYVYTEEYGTDIGNYFKPSSSWFCMGIPCKVTHWMPLPEPPREE